MTTLAVVGSRELQAVPQRLLLWIKETPAPIVLLRHPVTEEAARWERMVAYCCESIGVPYGWMKPVPGKGRAGTFERDMTMVGRSDVVLAFFAGDEMSGGTEHVVEKAIDQNVPVYSYGVRDSELVMLGSFDPFDAWGRFTV